MNKEVYFKLGLQHIELEFDVEKLDDDELFEVVIQHQYNPQHNYVRFKRCVELSGHGYIVIFFVLCYKEKGTDFLRSIKLRFEIEDRDTVSLICYDKNSIYYVESIKLNGDEFLGRVLTKALELSGVDDIWDKAKERYEAKMKRKAEANDDR